MADEKILKDEILSEEQLDQVAGGNVQSVWDDAHEFEKLGLKIIRRYLNDNTVIFLPDVEPYLRNDMTEIFDKCGVEWKYDPDAPVNYYFVDGKEITPIISWTARKSLAKRHLIASKSIWVSKQLISSIKSPPAHVEGFFQLGIRS